MVAKPNLFVLGFAKCGTTLLTSVLAAHRQVYLTPIKETYFFLNDQLYANGIDWYSEEFFSGAESGHRWVGEGTPYYANSEISMQRMAEAVNVAEARFIIALRDPVKRAYSAYWYAHRRGDDPRSFEEAISEEPQIVAQVQKAGGGWWQFGYCANSMYGRHLQTVLRYVKRSQLLILRDDELRDISALRHRLASFLEIDPTGFGRTPEISNEASIPRSTLVQELVLGKSPLKRLIQRLVPYNTRAKLRRSILAVNRKKADYPPMQPALARQLRARFEPDLQKAQDLSGVDLSRWFYDPSE